MLSHNWPLHEKNFTRKYYLRCFWERNMDKNYFKNYFQFYLSGPAFRECSIQVKETIKKALKHLIETLQRVTATAQ